jgi:DNA-directed RNA polymerase subunit RPC12/RpoP
MEVIVAEKRDCPRCGPIELRDSGNDFDCPHCGFKFCGRCFISILSGSGKDIKCPGCGEVLQLPGAVFPSWPAQAS